MSLYANTIPFIKDLIIQFWYSRAVPEPIPSGYQGMTVSVVQYQNQGVTDIIHNLIQILTILHTLCFRNFIT